MVSGSCFKVVLQLCQLRASNKPFPVLLGEEVPLLDSVLEDCGDAWGMARAAERCC